jgi:thiol-disulfide isomerase/thioredoxin
MVKKISINVFLLIRLTAFSNQESVNINIKVPAYENETLSYCIGSSAITYHFQTDTLGSATIQFELKTPSFVSFFSYNNVPFTLYLSPGNRIEVLIENDKGYVSGFSDKQKSLNEYLLEIVPLLNKMSEYYQKDTINDINKLIQISEDCEYKLNQLYSKYYFKIMPEEQLDSALKHIIKSAILNEKEYYLMAQGYTAQQIDSLQLEYKLKIKHDWTKNDATLIQYPNYFTNSFLYSNCKRYLDKVKSPMDQGQEIESRFLDKINRIKNAQQYSSQIKTQLLFEYVVYELYSHGYTQITDSVAIALRKAYPSYVYYHRALDKYYDLSNHLFPGKLAPYLQGVSADGKVVSLKELKGKVVFIDVWATWCVPCVKALPRIMELQQKFKNNTEVVFMYLCVFDQEESWKKYLKDHTRLKGIQLRLQQEDEPFYNEKWLGGGIPRYILIDKQGNMIDAFARNNSYEKLAEMIEEASRK